MPTQKIIDIRNVRYDKQAPALHERQLKIFLKIKYLFFLFLVTEDEYLDILILDVTRIWSYSNVNLRAISNNIIYLFI